MKLSDKIANFKNRSQELNVMKEMVNEAIAILHSSTSSITDFGKV